MGFDLAHEQTGSKWSGPVGEPGRRRLGRMRLFGAETMRHLRWKRGYLTGFLGLDRAKQGLHETLQGLNQDLDRVEHCQDIVDLLTELNGQARGLFEIAAGNEAEAGAVLRDHRREIAETLEARLPLPALGTPACRDCDLCERAERLLVDRLGDAAPSRSERQAAAEA